MSTTFPLFLESFEVVRDFSFPAGAWRLQMWTLLSILGHLKRAVIANEVTRPEGNDDSIAVEAVDFFNGADNEAEETEESRCVPNSPASVSGIGMDFSPHIEIKSTVNLSENESPVIKTKSQTEQGNQSCPLSQSEEDRREVEKILAAFRANDVAKLNEFLHDVEKQSKLNGKEKRKERSPNQSTESASDSEELEWNDEFEQNAEVLQHKTVEQLRTPGDVSPPGNVSANDSLQISAAFRSFLLLTSTPATNSTCASPLQQQLSMYEEKGTRPVPQEFYTPAIDYDN
ncbi:hypothetical protein Q1695_009426 [Nippostrongylus brasiliensis]|nr:hypothetical protein Q1695_009426 [Nippostrongylus brasiliensis]